MTSFEKFTKIYNPGTECRPAPTIALEKYSALLPSELLEHWRNFGWCAYGDGLIWIIDPDDLADVLDDWLGPGHGAIPFCRTAFADVFVWHQESVKSLAVQFGKFDEVMQSIAVFFDGPLCSDWYVNDMLQRKLFRQALKRLGPLQYDQCYAFEPVLALGGTGEVDTTRKVKLREYLGILSQIVEVEFSPSDKT